MAAGAWITSSLQKNSTPLPLPTTTRGARRGSVTTPPSKWTCRATTLRLASLELARERSARISDPRLFSGADAVSRDTVSMPTPLIEFPADDADRARRFWKGVLGTELAPRPAAAGSGWESEREGVRLGIHERGPGPGDTASLPYFTVDELDETVQRVIELGGSVIHPGERWAICRDSEGSPFALAQQHSRL